MERWQQIESLFQEALQRDPAERDAYVREACHGDAGLQREVTSLLANHHEGTDFEPWAAAAAAQLIEGSPSLKAGQRLGPYEILAPIGKGGMGEVYRARDTRLHRDVAIKICAARFSERFEREARAIASLNHPNICQLHDVGPNFLVMELVEGENLTGPLPVETALNYARQIAEALEAAHEKGIVHRDLKPANVKVTPAGVVKVLDFGLAKAAEPEPSGNPSESPTRTMSPTRAGVILGTAPYMAPEQARGKPLDKRADIWAFGCVVYEMLNGRQAFHGETTSDILAAVLKEEPDWSRIPTKVQPLLRRCLVKDPKHRLRDIGDAMPLLDGLPEVALARQPWPWLAVLALASALLAVWLLRPKPEEPLLQLEITAPPGYTFGAMSGYRYAISPDGSKLAFVAISADGKRSLWVRPLGASQATRLPGTEGAVGPFWDPASRWIAFLANGELQKIEVAGGQPQMLCNAVLGYFAGTWSHDGVILFSDASRTIRRVSAAGGAPSQVFPLDESRRENSQLWPQFLPDDRRFLYSSGGQQSGVTLGSLDGKSRPQMINPSYLSGYYARSPEGKTYLLFVRGRQLVAQAFDAAKVVVSGEPVFIAGPLQYAGPSFSASENGVLIFRRTQGGTQLTWFNRDGRPVGTAAEAGPIFSPRISPDQKSAAFSRFDGMTSDIWLFDGEHGNTTRFTSGPDICSFPVWSPDGSRIAFIAHRSNETLVIERPASGIGKETVLYRTHSGDYAAQSWSHDGRWLLLSNASSALSSSFHLLPIGSQGWRGERKPIPFPESPSNGLDPSLSPDGRWFLYSSTQTGSREVFVESMPAAMGGPATGAKRQVSIAGGVQPAWRADGKEIFYVAADGKMMSVPVESGPRFKLGAPKPLFPTRLEFYTQRQYDVSADGKRFLLAQPLEESASVPITVIVNWPALLKKGAGAP